jgi:hypothetical protein
MARIDKEWLSDMMKLPKPLLIHFLNEANIRAKRAEALKPSHNTQSKPCQHAWEPIVGKRCVTCGKFDYAITDTPY